MHRRHTARLISAATAALFICVAAADERGDAIRKAFGPWQGCALIEQLDRYVMTRTEFGTEQCTLPLSPCSTFKIPNTLIGLQLDLLEGPEHTRPWDGVERWNPDWNRDHNLATAMSQSVVWYYQALAREIGDERMSTWLKRLDYGNADASSGIDTFWLGGSLAIDARGQLAFLQQLTRGHLPVRPEHMVTVRNLLQQDSDLPGQLYGKTGSCLGDEDRGQPDHGWYVGWLDHGTVTNRATTWFVVNIRGEGGTGRKARPIALELLNMMLNEHR